MYVINTIVVLLSLFAMKPSFGQVTVTGTLEPKFSIEYTEADLQRLADVYRNLAIQRPIKIDINTLLDKEDEPALMLARQRIQDIFYLIATTVADQQMIYIRLSALSQIAHLNTLAGLFEAYQAKFQDNHAKLIHTFLSVDTKLVEALKKCSTDTCVALIDIAQKDLMEVGALLNQRLEIPELSRQLSEFKFKSSVIQTSLRSSYDKILPPNQEHSDYSIVLAGVLAPFWSAANLIAKTSENVAQLLVAPRTTQLKLSASAVSVDSKRIRRDQQYTVDCRIFEIVTKKSCKETSQIRSHEERQVDRATMKAEVAAVELVKILAGYQHFDGAVPGQTIMGGYLQIGYGGISIDDSLVQFAPFSVQMTQDGRYQANLSVMTMETSNPEVDSVIPGVETYFRMFQGQVNAMIPHQINSTLDLVNAQIELPIVSSGSKEKANPFSAVVGVSGFIGRTRFDSQYLNRLDLPDGFTGVALQENPVIDGFHGKIWGGLQASLALWPSARLIARAQVRHGAQSNSTEGDASGFAFLQSADLDLPQIEFSPSSSPQKNQIVTTDRMLVLELQQKTKGKTRIGLFYQGQWQTGYLDNESRWRYEDPAPMTGTHLLEYSARYPLRPVRIHQIGIKVAF